MELSKSPIRKKSSFTLLSTFIHYFRSATPLGFYPVIYFPLLSYHFKIYKATPYSFTSHHWVSLNAYPDWSLQGRQYDLPVGGSTVHWLLKIKTTIVWLVQKLYMNSVLYHILNAGQGGSGSTFARHAWSSCTLKLPLHSITNHNPHS